MNGIKFVEYEPNHVKDDASFLFINPGHNVLKWRSNGSDDLAQFFFRYNVTHAISTREFIS